MTEEDRYYIKMEHIEMGEKMLRESGIVSVEERPPILAIHPEIGVCRASTRFGAEYGFNDYQEVYAHLFYFTTMSERLKLEDILERGISVRRNGVKEFGVVDKIMHKLGIRKVQPEDIFGTIIENVGRQGVWELVSEDELPEILRSRLVEVGAFNREDTANV